MLALRQFSEPGVWGPPEVWSLMQLLWWGGGGGVCCGRRHRNSFRKVSPVSPSRFQISGLLWWAIPVWDPSLTMNARPYYIWAFEDFSLARFDG